jgi:hypothetical protein
MAVVTASGVLDAFLLTVTVGAMVRATAPVALATAVPTTGVLTGETTMVAGVMAATAVGVMANPSCEANKPAANTVATTTAPPASPPNS